MGCQLKYLKGGMCVLSAKGGTYRAWTRLLAKDGLMVASVDFRNSSGVGARAPFPAGLNDCVSALKWLGDREEADFPSFRENNGAGIPVDQLIYYAKGIALSRRLAGAGKLVSHQNHLGTTHALPVYVPIFNANDITELSAKAITAFALRNA